MRLPSGLNDALAQTLGASPENNRPVGGGDISQAVRITCLGRDYLVKYHTAPPVPAPGWPEMFAAEAQGLRLLADTGAVRVPGVVAHAAASGSCPTHIVMEWIDAAHSADQRSAGEELGRRLADQHRCTQKMYGLGINNYCGATPQSNSHNISWTGFYGEERLLFQTRLAEQKGRMPATRRSRVEALIEHLGDLIAEDDCAPSLLHGDLWGGNWMIDAGGQPVLIDPAVYYGDREAELAMCHLFGGFPHEFFASYDEAWPPAPGRDDRLGLYKLYHVLNHLNLFGESYGSQVDSILRRYVL